MMRIKNSEECSGCTACVSACPMQCIEMKPDREGFLYPMLTDAKKCIDCGLCEKICPVKNTDTDTSEKTILRLACQNLNEDTRKNSTSGGVFSAIAEDILKRNGVVIGAGFRDDMHVIHKLTTNKDDLKELRASKYVQSELGDVFLSIKNILTQEEVPVFFVGTPCQTAGLLSFLGKKYENMYTADLACYGVPSPSIYDKWISMIEKKYGSEVKEIYFRDKKYGYAGVNVKLVLQNGKILEDRTDVKSFTKTFFSKINIRPSCYDCHFRTKVKQCDFTFGDFWEIGEYDLSMDDNVGTTLVSIHTEKGRDLISKLENIKICNIDRLEGKSVAEYYERQRLVRAIPAERNAFFADAERMEYMQLLKKYFPNKPKDILAIILKPLIGKMPSVISNTFFKSLKNSRMKR